MTALLRCCGKGYASSVINMANIVTCKTKDGETVQYVDEVIGSGSMKDVYFSPDKSYVVAFYHKPQNEQARDRIDMITGRYRQNIFGQSGGEYWKDLFCWRPTLLSMGIKSASWFQPTKATFSLNTALKTMISWHKRPVKRKANGFASASNQNKFSTHVNEAIRLPISKVCLLLTRAVRRMHAAGLCHSDLSYKKQCLSIQKWDMPASLT